MKIPTLNKQFLPHPLVPALIERRRHPRIPLRLPTEYFPEGSTKGRVCHTINICEGGVLLFLPEKVRVGQRLGVAIYYFFEYELICFEAAGKVVWTEKVDDSETKYRSALEFTDLAINDLENLKKFLKKIFY